VDSNLPLLAWRATQQINFHCKIDAASAFLVAVAREQLLNHFPTETLTRTEFKNRIYPHHPQWYVEKLFLLLDITHDGLICAIDASVAAIAHWLTKEEPIALDDLKARIKGLGIPDFPLKTLNSPLVNKLIFSDWLANY
jgi:hypothetical protein